MPKYTNISDGPRGIHTKTGLVMVEKGQTVDVELAVNGNAEKGEKPVTEEPNEEWFEKATGAAAKAAEKEAPAN